MSTETKFHPDEVARRLLDTPPSMFGSGLVVCLAKFAQHMEGIFWQNCYFASFWMNMDAEARQKLEMEAAQFRYGDSARRLAAVKSVFIMNDGDEAKALAHAIESCMNCASDHFYDLDREKAPLSLIELADLTLRMGHGFTGYPWTIEDLDRCYGLFKQSCLELDRMLGICPDWGEN